MSDERFNLVFKGQLAKSVDMNTAVRNLAQLFKIDPAKAKSLFGGQATVLKRDLDMDTANKYRAAIKKAGAIAELQMVESPKAAPAAAAQPAPQKSQGKAVFGARDPVTAQSPSNASPPKSGSQVAPRPPLPTVDESGDEFTTSAGVFGAPRPQPANLDVPDFGVAPAGVDLLKADEKLQVESLQIDTSALSLKESEGNLLNDDEYEEVVPLPVDTEAFDIAPPGADVLKPEERKPEQVTEVDTSGLSLGKLGENLAPPKPTAPPPPDTSDISLAD